LFKPYTSKEFKPKNRVFTDKRSNNVYQSISLATLSLPCFTSYKELFYSRNKKIVPLNIKHLLSPIGLAY
jgi:hypothetical protein